MPWGMFFDKTYILIILGMLISFAASIYLKSTYHKYGQMANRRGITGAQFAKLMLNNENMNDVDVVAISGELSDNYLHTTKTLSLSRTTYSQATIGAIGVAGHEVGHAMQHNKNYMPFNARKWLVPVANFGANASWPIILLGILFGYNQTLLNIGILLFSLTFLFQVVTLPVEFNASRRALQSIKNLNVLDKDEFRASKKVLRAAALTYVAGATAIMLQLLRLIILFGGRDRD